ncbi:Calcium-dependent protein kinase 22 [Phytophthora cinnamomi]|uniref:Calcium-dependent protein kinase 22 n=1 Tax=Phytophthora cinnamomi TaxID=4785 RepID=UPI00355A7B01|nr:Calcium-dependent protein kinase 22 [Phytophthora cinnamomi]
MLKRKSSSVSVLDVTGGASSKGAEHNGDLPRVGRDTGSLQDLRPDGDNNGTANRTQSAAGSKRGDKKKKLPKNGWSNETGDALPMVTQTSDSQGDSKSSPSKVQRESTRRRRAGDITLTRPATIAVVVKYQLGQHELKKFKTCFKQIDLDASGVIDYDEFFEFIDETKTPFSESLFRMIDSDSNGSIDFEEFVHAMVLYCMYTRDEILHFAFDTFDPAATGSIGDKELRRLISMVNDGQSKFTGNIHNALAEFDRNKDGVIDFEEFKNMNKRFPMLLFPCFRLQDRMQKSTLGDSHWLQLHKRLYERLKTENYKRKHNGALPALTLVGAIVKFLRLDTRDVYQP